MLLGEHGAAQWDANPGKGLGSGSEGWACRRAVAALDRWHLSGRVCGRACHAACSGKGI